MKATIKKYPGGWMLRYIKVKILCVSFEVALAKFRRREHLKLHERWGSVYEVSNEGVVYLENAGHRNPGIASYLMEVA